jgi:hypothetical protein
MTAIHQATLITKRHTQRQIGRAVALAMLAGQLAGAAWGILARVAMRIVALAAHHYPNFSWQGTLGIIMLGVFLGALISLTYLAVRRLVPARGRALAFGTLVLLALAIPMNQIIQGEGVSQKQLGLALFLPLLFGYGSLVAALFETFTRLISGTRSRLTTALLIAPVVVEVGLGALVYLISTNAIQL